MTTFTGGSEKITFPGSYGDDLDGRLELPEGEPRAVALFAHCFTCNKDIFAARRIARALAEQGFAVLRFDFTGLGSSEGEFANTNFSSNVDDLVAAADFLRANYRAPTVIIGHSLGGAAVLAAAPRIPELRAVATINAPADPGHVQHLFAAARPEIEARGEAEVVLAKRTFRIKKQFLEDIAEARVQEHLRSLGKALLVFHAPRDQTVGVENAQQIFQAAKHPKSFVSLDDADHLLSRHEDAIYVANVLAAWASRYLGDATAATTAPSRPLQEVATEHGTVLVAETRDAKFTQTISAGRHTFKGDEPVSVGGTDTGPAPYDYLLAALGTCTSMTVRLYAERKGWPLTKASVRLKHGKIHAADCETCETKEGRVDRIERELELEGPLDAEQRARLLEIADKCPVHRTLTHEIVIETKLR